MPLVPFAEWLRQTEADIADFEARMRERPFTVAVGERVELLGEVFEVAGCVRDGMPGYWLRAGQGRMLFLPLDLEGNLCVAVH